MKRLLHLALLTVTCLLTAQVRAGDWPQFRYDAGRTAASPHELPADLQLRWTRTLPAPRPAFPHEPRLAYDTCYEPVVLGHTLFVPSMVTDSVTAFDTGTGNQRWRFIAEGPVRFAPVAWEGKVYFVSDDGYLYCLDASDGSLQWRFRGLPEGKHDRKVIGHGRLVSLWPARGGPVLADGVVYFAAGLWPTEGVFVHAVDAESGQAVWSNTDSDHIPKSNWDHGVGKDAGLTPQGYLAIVGDRLVVPCGAQLPAFLDLKTGKLQTYTMGWGGRLGLPKGCWFVAGINKYLSHAGDLYDITRPSKERFLKTKPGEEDYKPMLYPGGWTRLDIERANQRELDRFRQPVMTAEVAYESDQGIVARDLTSYTLQEWTTNNIPAHRSKDEIPEKFRGVFRRLWELPSKLDVHVKAGSRLYVGGPGVVEAIETTDQDPKVVWHAEIDGTPQRMLAADEKLFVVTVEGSLFAFASGQPGEATTHTMATPPPTAADKWTEHAHSILEATDVRDGYALVLGIDRGRLVEELVRQSKLHVIAVDDDPDKVTAIRNRLDSLGLYGTRASVLVGDPVTYPFSPYMANLVVSELPDRLDRAGERALARSVFHTLRPYGGVAVVWDSLADVSRIKEIVQDEAFPGASVREVGDFVMLARSGALPGVADWSHAEANASSTGASEDDFIRSPMAVLWFDAAQRWHKYPGQNQVRVVSGRLVLYEEGRLRASDVYTGRTLWEIEVPLGQRLLTDPLAREAIRYAKHRQWNPKARLSWKTQLVVVEDAIYLSESTSCLKFDPATGEPTGRIDLPNDLKTPWANLRVYGDYLVGNSGAHVLCMQRRTGELLWRVEAVRSGLSLAVGGDKVFCAELADPKRGEDETLDGSMFALKVTTGERVWQRAGGARLRYSPSLDIVVTPSGFYRGSDGEPLLPKSDSPRPRLVVQGNGLPKTGVPGFIAGSTLLTGNEETLRVYDIPSGDSVGEPLEWSRRGCTGTRASKHLLTTRYHGNSAWIDLENREITQLLGVRPGCSVNNNLYPANGVLNIPNLTAGCTCNYAPVSMAFVPAGVVKRSSVSGQEQTWTDQITEDFAREFRLRSLGPALRPGRVADIAVHPRNRSIWYVVVGSGGLWKTVNRGVSFEPIFDKGGSYSLGCVAIDPREPDTIWLGTGENNSNRSVGFGDGIYKSTDAGASWERMGLNESEHIGVILVHPGKSDVVYVAAEGPLWSSGGDRGLYKTTDGGRNWKCVLEISEHTGVTGIVFDPRDPEVLYAAAYQRQRHNGLLVGGGPETAIYKTTDGGGSWRKLENGIPTVDKGRIALAVSPHNPDVVYALVAAQRKESGLFRSADAGETWVRQSGFKVVDPQYYGELYADPHQFDRIYAMDVLVQLSEDAGTTFKGMKWPIHVDSHAMVLDPTDVNHLLVGNDGGLYESYDRGSTWRHFVNMPTPQFYRVAVDNSLPFYHIYGGTQDNGSMGGPSRTVNRAGIRSSEWMVTGGSDGFQSRADPEDPEILYVTTQNGGISRLNKRTGHRAGIAPKKAKDGPKVRWHWDTPFVISPFSPTRLYLGGNRLFRSDDRGDNWRPVSGDLTRQLNAHEVSAMGRIWPEDAVQKNRFTTTLSVCSALEESPLKEGLLYVGTDDGLIQISEDGGAQWHRHGRFPGIPRRAYVSDVMPSRHDVDVVYAAFNHYQEGDFRPYLLKSSDRGGNWTSISANLPERGPVWSIVEDHVNPKLLFVGTEFGLYFSVDGGGHWTGLRSGVAVAAFRDLAIQRRENDLVGATFGRGFYVLDDYSALRDLTETSLAAEGALLSSGGARAYHETTLLRAAPGNFTTPNPAFGAVLTYHLRDGLAEGERLTLVIEDAEGKPVGEMEGDGSKGLHRLNWDLRAGKLDLKRQRRGSRAEAMVDPGWYTVKLVKVAGEERMLLGVPREVRVRKY